MTELRARRLAWAAFGLYGVLLASSVLFSMATKRTMGQPSASVGDFLFSVSTASSPVVAVLILTRQPRNRIGWILMGIGLAWVIGSDFYGEFAISRDPTDIPRAHSGPGEWGVVHGATGLGDNPGARGVERR